MSGKVVDFSAYAARCRRGQRSCPAAGAWDVEMLMVARDRTAAAPSEAEGRVRCTISPENDLCFEVVRPGAPEPLYVCQRPPFSWPLMRDVLAFLFGAGA